MRGARVPFNSLDFPMTLIYDAPTFDGCGKGKRTAGMSGRTLSQHNLSRAVLLWTWLVVAFSLALGSAFPPAPSHLSGHCDTLATPTAALELVATPTQKSTSIQPLIKGFIVLPAIGICITDSKAALPCPLWDDAPSLLLPAVWQSPSLPRPPPSA